MGSNTMTDYNEERCCYGSDRHLIRKRFIQWQSLDVIENKKLRYGEEHSASPHFSRHFTRHYLAVRTPKPAFDTWLCFRNSTNLSDRFVIASDDRYEPIIVFTI